jgi:hypothetical protein
LTRPAEALPVGTLPAGTVPSRTVPSRTVWCADALPWLEQQAPLSGCSVVTSLPDVSGLPGLSLDAWKHWFMRAAGLCLAACPDEGVTIFYQTDIKIDGTWVDKSYLCHRAAEERGVALLWHKIACRRPAGQAAFGRPGYSHLLCYARVVRDRPLHPSADVLSRTGLMTWSQAMGVEACRLACRYVLTHTVTRTVVDPFCGHGTVLAVANRMGLGAVGVDITKKRARKARNLQLDDAAFEAGAPTEDAPGEHAAAEGAPLEGARLECSREELGEGPV